MLAPPWYFFHDALRINIAWGFTPGHIYIYIYISIAAIVTTGSSTEVDPRYVHLWDHLPDRLRSLNFMPPEPEEVPITWSYYHMGAILASRIRLTLGTMLDVNYFSIDLPHSLTYSLLRAHVLRTSGLVILDFCSIWILYFHIFFLEYQSFWWLCLDSLTRLLVLALVVIEVGASKVAFRKINNRFLEGINK